MISGNGYSKLFEFVGLNGYSFVITVPLIEFVKSSEFYVNTLIWNLVFITNL